MCRWILCKIWATNEKRPILVIKECFAHAIIDICWSNNGRILTATSHDGTIFVIKFGVECFGGRIATIKEQKNIIFKQKSQIGTIISDPTEF